MSNNKLRAAIFALAILFCISVPSEIEAQCASYTQVTGTIIDPHSIPYAFGSVTADLFPSGGTPTCNPASGGTRLQFSTHQGPTPLDASGSFTMALPPGSIIQPGGTQWTFTVAEAPGVATPLGFGPVSFQVTLTISGATQNVTGPLTAAAKVLSYVGAASGGPGLTYLGAYSSTTTYAINNVVTYGGSSYVAIAPSTGVTPGTDTTIWQVFAAAGLNGTNGINGINGTPGFSPNSLIAGCGVEWTGLYNFTIGACQYIINNAQFNSPLTNITLTAADPTNPRIDAIYVDTTGAVGVLTGTPSATPAIPSIDPSQQIQISFVYVAAGSTSPSQITRYDIFHECTEWTASTNNAGQINICSTNNPYDGTKDIEATAAARTTYVQLTNGSTVDLATTNTLVFYVRSKAPWNAARTIAVQWFNGSTAKGNSILVGDGQFGFSSSITGGYQQIAIPSSLFQIGGIPVNRVRFTVSGTGAGGATIGFYLDDITLQAGTQPFTLPNGIMIFDGNWSAATAYPVNHVVISGGESWVALVANANSAPSNSNANWQDLGPALPLSVANGGTGGAAYPAHSILLGEGTNPLNAICANALTGQILTVVNGSDPACQSQGVPDGNSGAAVTTTPYNVKCDDTVTTFAVLDRMTTLKLRAGASVVNMPDSTGTGCGSNFAISIIDDGAGSVTVNRGGADTFTVCDGGSCTDGATSMTLTNGAYVTFNNGQGTIWNARVVKSGGGVTSWSGDTIVACNVNSTGAVTMTLCPTPPNFIIAGPPSAGSSNLVQSAAFTTGTNGAPITVALPNAVKPGDLVITVVSSAANKFTTDTSGDSFTTNFTSSGSGQLSFGFTCNAIGGAETFTVTGGATFYGHLQVYEFTGNPSVSCLDTITPGNQAGGTNFSVATSGGAAQPTELIFGAFNLGGGGVAANIFPGSGETSLAQNISNATVTPSITRSVVQNLTTGLAGIQTVQAISDQPPANWVGFIAAFKLNSTGSAPLTARPEVCGDLTQHSPCPVYNSTRIAQVAAIPDSTMFVTTASGLFNFQGSINCTGTSASATATLNLKYTDTASVAQTVSVTDPCTSLVTTGIPNLNPVFRAKIGTNITWGVTIANTPTYDVDVRLFQLP